MQRIVGALLVAATLLGVPTVTADDEATAGQDGAFNEDDGDDLEPCSLDRLQTYGLECSGGVENPGALCDRFGYDYRDGTMPVLPRYDDQEEKVYLYSPVFAGPGNYQETWLALCMLVPSIIIGNS